MAATTLPLTSDHYETGLTWSSYLALMTDHREVSNKLYENAILPSATRERFSGLVAKRGGTVSVSAMTEDWCGDSAVTLPIVARLAEEVAGIRLRIFIRKRFPELHSAYIDGGYESIPVLSFFDSSWSEIGRWMERPKSADERVGAWISERPKIAELRRSGKPDDQRELKAIFAGLVEEMAGWYRNGLWNDVLDEIASVLR